MSLHSLIICLLALHWAHANLCIESILHKPLSGPEHRLEGLCSPWKNNSCCTYETSLKINDGSYSFNFNHCKRLSEKCRQRFVQDLCFYECSPNVSPWIVKVNMKSRKERYLRVPLCRSDCEQWFSDCSSDETCTDNWFRNFKWVSSGNKCPDEAQCKQIKDVFKNASEFCEKVWDNSWKVVDDSEKCFKLSFSDKKNPNDEIYEYYSNNKLPLSAGFNLHSNYYLIFTLLLCKIFVL